MSARDLLPVGPPETASLVLADGTRLDADVYRPEAPGRFPVLLMRQPYGRKIASTLVYAHPAWYAAHGYIVVIQDVRGAGTSTGDFRLFANDVADGAETVAWAADLLRSTGDVGMYGFSYQGATQLLALAGGAPALKALAPAMIGWDVATDWAYSQGAFCLAGGVGWAAQMGALMARRAGDEAAYQALSVTGKGPTPLEAMANFPEVLKRHGAYTHFADWIGSPDPEAPYWATIAPKHRLAGREIDVPMLHIGGWFDGMLMGTLNAQRDIAATSAKPQPMIIGPWTHVGWAERATGTDFGPEAASDIDGLQIAWFDRHLKGVETAWERPAVSLFDLGTKGWRAFDAWPEPTPTRLALGTGGRATIRSDDGTLGIDAPAGLDVIVHDPWRPAPSVGGALGQPPGMAERGQTDARFDVATYTGAPIDQPITIAGRVAAELWVTCDRPSFDVSAILSIVEPDGRVFSLTQGHARIDGTPNGPVTIEIGATCATLRPGQRLRLSLAGAAYPAFAVNTGTGASAAEARLIEAEVTSLWLRSGAATPSALLLPIVE